MSCKENGFKPCAPESCSPLVCYTPEFENVASVLIDMTKKSARKLLFEPPATVCLGLCSAATRDVSYDSLVTELVLSAVKTWLDTHAKESHCKVLDSSSMPPAMVGLSLCSAAMPDVSSDSLFAALVLNALKRGWSGLRKSLFVRLLTAAPT